MSSARTLAASPADDWRTRLAARTHGDLAAFGSLFPTTRAISSYS
jgi:hypothetical protein